MIVHLNKTALPGVSLAPLSLDSVILHSASIDEINQDVASGKMPVSAILTKHCRVMTEIIADSARRGRSKATPAEITSMLSAKTVFDVYFAVINLSGFEDCDDDAGE